MESGTIYHMIKNLNSLSNIREYNEVTQFEDDNTTIAPHKGTYIGFTNKYKTSLHNELYIPKFKRNLLAIDNLSEKGYKIIFHFTIIIIKILVSIYNDKKEKKIFTTKSNKSRIYKIWTYKNHRGLNNNKNKKKNMIYSNMIMSLSSEKFQPLVWAFRVLQPWQYKGKIKSYQYKA